MLKSPKVFQFFVIHCCLFTCHICILFSVSSLPNAFYFVVLVVKMPEMAHDWWNKIILFYSILFYSIRLNGKQCRRFVVYDWLWCTTCSSSENSARMKVGQNFSSLNSTYSRSSRINTMGKQNIQCAILITINIVAM